MTGWMRNSTPLALALGLILAAGCASDNKPTQSQVDPAGQMDLNAPDGGLTTDNELPAFGDSGLQAEAAHEQPFADVVADQPPVRDLAGLAGTRMYALTVTWGQLEDDTASHPGDHGGTTDGDRYDWSGRLTLDDGAVLLRSVISFERGDEIILPRTDRFSLAWNSHTDEGFDGIRVLLYEPRSISDVDPNVLTFSAGSYTTTIPVRDLADLDRVVTVDDQGNRVHFQAFRIDRGAADVRGFLRGRWNAIAPGESSASFEGVWISTQNGVAGHVRGIYGIDAEGRKVFFGKFIDPLGRFQGILRGRWEAVDRESTGTTGAEGGWFRGEWAGTNGEAKGMVQGHWRTRFARPGVFEGRWCEGCSFEASGDLGNN